MKDNSSSNLNESFGAGINDLRMTQQNVSQKNSTITKLTGSFNAGLKDLRAVVNKQDSTKNVNRTDKYDK